MLYFFAVFWFLPWRTATLLWLDVALHYLLAVLCLLMPFFVPANATELIDAAVIFLIVCGAIASRSSFAATFEGKHTKNTYFKSVS